MPGAARPNTRRVAALALAVFVLGSCGSSGDDAALTTSTSTTTVAVTTTAGPTTTEASTTPPPVSSTATSSTLPTTSVGAPPVDTGPPPAPTNVTCAPGGGSQEVLLEWDAPGDPDDIVDVRLYVNDGSGFARVNTFTVDSGQILIGAHRWSAVAYPVPIGTEIQMAVTIGDAGGNESGWNPIDVYSEYSGADCVS